MFGETFRASYGNESRTAGANIITGAIVEVRQRNTGNTHVARGRLHRLANDLRGVGNRNQVEIFAKALTRIGFQKRSIALLVCLCCDTSPEMNVRVWLPGQRQRCDGTRDYELIFSIENGNRRNDGAV